MNYVLFISPIMAVPISAPAAAPRSTSTAPSSISTSTSSIAAVLSASTSSSFSAPMFFSPSVFRTL